MSFRISRRLMRTLPWVEPWRGDQSGAGHPARISATSVTGNLFSVLGVTPALGRSFLPDEERPGSAPVCILSDGLWKGRFGSDPKILGKAVTLNSEMWTVVGVMPAGFRFPRALATQSTLVRSSIAAHSRQTRTAILTRRRQGRSIGAASAIRRYRTVLQATRLYGGDDAAHSSPSNSCRRRSSAAE